MTLYICSNFCSIYFISYHMFNISYILSIMCNHMGATIFDSFKCMDLWMSVHWHPKCYNVFHSLCSNAVHWCQYHCVFNFQIRMCCFSQFIFSPILFSDLGLYSSVVSCSVALFQMRQ